MIEDQPLLVGIDLAIDSLFFLWAAVSQKTRRILYASSSAAYPISRQCDQAFSYLTEDMIDFAKGVLAPDMTYGWSKLTGEYLARLAVGRNQLRVGIVRPFSGKAGQAMVKSVSKASISASATGPMLPRSLESKVEQYLSQPRSVLSTFEFFFTTKTTGSD